MRSTSAAISELVGTPGNTHSYTTTTTAQQQQGTLHQPAHNCNAKGQAFIITATPPSQPQDLCSFAGGWRGKASSSARVYYVSSYFWDRATDSGIIADKAAIEWATTPKDFASKAGAVCGKDMDALKKDYVEVQQAHAPYFCLDLSFCYTMLTKGFKISEETKVTLVKQVKYNGQAIEAAWPLGAAINDLSS